MGYVSTRHQNSKIGMTTYYSRSPSLHLKGDWLAEAGFDTGTSVTVKISEGCLILLADNNEVQELREQLYQVKQDGRSASRRGPAFPPPDRIRRNGNVHPVEPHHAVFCRGTLPCQPVQQVPRRVVLPAFQIPLILRTARRDAPRRVVEIVRFAPPAVPFLRQFIPSVVVVLTVSERVRHHPAHPTVRFPALHPPCWVVYLPRVQPPLASEHLPVQVVARELADDLTVQVYLLEMPAAVVKLSLRSAVRGKVVAKHIPHVVMPSDGGFLPQSQRLSITLPVNKISDHYFR